MQLYYVIYVVNLQSLPIKNTTLQNYYSEFIPNTPFMGIIHKFEIIRLNGAKWMKIRAADGICHSYSALLYLVPFWSFPCAFRIIQKPQKAGQTTG